MMLFRDVASQLWISGRDPGEARNRPSIRLSATLICIHLSR